MLTSAGGVSSSIFLPFVLHIVSHLCDISVSVPTRKPVLPPALVCYCSKRPVVLTPGGVSVAGDLGLVADAHHAAATGVGLHDG